MLAQEVYDKTGDPKEIMWVDATNHIDLYDVEKYFVPAVNKTIEWFTKYLIEETEKSVTSGIVVNSRAVE